MDPIIKLEYRFENNQLQKLMLLPQMQQALHILQMPALELKFQLEAYLEENPLILIDEEKEEEAESEGIIEGFSPEEELDFTLKQFDWMEELSVDEDFSINQDLEKRDLYNRLIDSQYSLKEHLLLQLRKELSSDDLLVGELIVGYLEENGYLYTSIEEICQEHRLSFKKVKKVLKTIQTLDPYGIGASSLQESLLIQLRCLKKEGSLSFKILDKYYKDVLHNRAKKVTRSLKCSLEEYRAAIREISSLNFHLANSFSKDFTHLLIPDVILKEEENLKVMINDEYIPTMRLNPYYLKMLRDETASKEAKTFIQNKLNSFRWLLQNIERRNQTLIRITEALSQYHRDFFCSLKGVLSPLTMKTLAYDLNLNESTIVRAVDNKILCCSRGCIPIREFFTQSYRVQNGKVISSDAVKEAIKELIIHENKKKPLTDEEIHDLLNRKGIRCARRTIVKYRALLGFPSSKLRSLE